jgi:phosphopantothenoylcysteine decarboxylase/phosphopantothenate--cysteine ligase
MRVLLGVSGGIACYKVAHLVSRLVKANHEVRVVMTPAATRFVGPVTFETMSQHPVMLDIFDTGLGGHHLSPVEHIDWAKWAQIAVAAPLTACTLGKLANGIADNAFTTVWLALPASTPQVLCPAMNTRMWENAAVQRNVAWLAAQPQVTIVGPIFKRLADGDVGIGGLAEVPDLVAAIEEAAAQLGDQLP